MVEPRGWQKGALKKFKASDKDFFLIEATPGAGKTVFSGLCARHLMDFNAINFIVIVTPTTALKDAFEESFHKDLDIQISSVMKGGVGHPAKTFQGGAMTYQQLPNMITTLETWKKNGSNILFIFDEIHHASEDNIWGSAVESCSRISSKIIGMTGTPFRSDGGRISFVRYNDDGKCIPDYSFSYKNAVAANVCRELLFVHDDGIAEYVFNEQVEEHRISDAEKKNTGKVAATIFKKDTPWLNAVITKADEKLDEYRLTSNAGGLIVCRPGYNSNQDRHLYDVECVLRKITGESPVVITHDDPDANAKIKKFKKSNDKWIIAVRKISEGIDIKRLKVCVLASYPSSELLFRQIIGRVVRVENPNGYEDATVFMAKFSNLVEMANRVTEEAEAGLAERKKRQAGESEDGTAQRDSLFMPMSSTHEDGGGTSSYGEFFSPEEITFAEQVKSSHSNMRSVSVTHIARLHQIHGITPPNRKPQTKSKHEIIQGYRKELNALTRKYAFKVNPTNPPFQAAWAILNKRLNVKSLNDLCDNKEIEDIQNAIEIMKSTIARLG